MVTISSPEQLSTEKINFNETTIQTYGSLKADRNFEVSTSLNGHSISFNGDGWKKIEFPYKITSNTVLEFSFKSTEPGKIQGIGFDKNNRISRKKMFQIYGSHTLRNDTFKTYEKTAGEWKMYQIPVGEFFTGKVSYLTFANTQEPGQSTPHSTFKNIKIYESTPEIVEEVIRMIDTPPPTVSPAVVVESPLESLVEAPVDPESLPLAPITPQSAVAPTTRDPLKQPFASTSIWNMPIGSNAQYVDAQLEWAESAVVDADHFYVLDGADALQPLLNPGTWGQGRGTGTDFRNIALPLADDMIVPDATDTETPNNAAAFLMPNSRTLVQANPLSRDRPGGFVHGYRSADEDLYGSGIRGGHAGSGLSSIGGTIRQGELTGGDPIRHALKVNLPASLYLSYSQGQNGGRGYRWPTTQADGYANEQTYGGNLPGLVMGALLAIPPDATPESLGLTTDIGRKLFHAFQDYGAYVADDVLWNAYAIEMENGVTDEIADVYGYELDGWDSYYQGELYEDIMRLFTELHIVDNNGPESIGGGGTPRVDLLPELDDSATPIYQGTNGDDQVSGGETPDTMQGNGGNDQLQGHGASDYIEGGDGNDTITGGGDADHLFGDNGEDRMTGGDGQDYLDGGWWHDHLEGGAGDDMLSGWQGNDVLDGGAGVDTLVESLNHYFSSADFTLTNTALIGNGLDQLRSIEHVILLGGDGKNTLDASGFTGGTVYLDGGLDDDVLIGTPNADTFSASVGNDQLTGGEGGDRFLLTSRITLLTSNRPNPLNSGNYDKTADFNYVAANSDTSVGNGQSGYVLLHDFTPEEGDVIELQGSADRYVLGASPISTPGQAIYLDQDQNGQVSASDSLVAIVKDQSTLNLNSPSFEYLP